MGLPGGCKLPPAAAPAPVQAQSHSLGSLRTDTRAPQSCTSPSPSWLWKGGTTAANKGSVSYTDRQTEAWESVLQRGRLTRDLGQKNCKKFLSLGLYLSLPALLLLLATVNQKRICPQKGKSLNLWLAGSQLTGSRSFLSICTLHTMHLSLY